MTQTTSNSGVVLIQNHKEDPPGIAFIEEEEGIMEHEYKDSAGLPTIGIGHLLTEEELTSGKIYIAPDQVDWKNGLTKLQIDQLLEQDLMLAEQTINDTVKVPLKQTQFDSLVSFVFNIGNNAFRQSTLLKVLNNEDYLSVPNQMRQWIHAGGKVDAGLQKRREDEIALWNTP